MNILKNVKQLLQRRTALQSELNKINAILAPLGGGETGNFEAKVGTAVARVKKTRKPMSAAAKAKISAAAKARWKKAKAAGKTRL